MSGWRAADDVQGADAPVVPPWKPPQPQSQAPPFAPPPPTATVPMTFGPPPHHHHALRATVAIAMLAVAAVAVGLVVTMTRDNGTTSGDDPAFADAHAAFVAGQCGDAIELYDQLLHDGAWVESSGAVDQARQERTECADYLAITAEPTDASVVLAGYLAFLHDRPGTVLSKVVVADVGRLYESAGWTALTPQSCDELDAQTFAVVIPSASTDAMLGCAATYETASRSDDAYALAIKVLSTSGDTTLTDQATRIVLNSPAACSNLIEVRSYIDLAARPDDHAAFLQSCMVAATAQQDLDTVAALQIAFLTALPLHPDAPAIEAALIDNVTACSQLDAMRATPAIATREGFLATKTLACAQVSEYVGDLDQALASYQWFLDNAPSDPRTEIARSGVARILIAQARQDRAVAGLDTDGFGQPPRSGGTGSGQSRLVIYNDHPDELQIVMSGPESRIETVPGSPTSTVYSGADADCRFDVPSITIDLAPGVYDILLRRPSYIGVVSTWTLSAGAEYSSTYCMRTDAAA